MHNQDLLIQHDAGMPQFIKQTRSLCSVCLKEVDATLYNDRAQVVLSKYCSIHGMTSDIVDPDAKFYFQCVSKNKKPYAPYGTVIPVSFRCDLNCAWCYLPDRGKEFSTENIKAIIDKDSSRYIVFSGGEPTLRPELASLIEYVKQQHPEKRTVLLTNGVKLADQGFVSHLKKAGLHYCILSLNGFRPETHLALNGRNLFYEKRCALENLKKLNLRTILSMTLARGINEDEFKDVFLFAMSNLDFIRQIRLRNVSTIGTYREQTPIYLTDMLKLVTDATGFSLDELCCENKIANRNFKTGNYFAANVFNILKRRSKDVRDPQERFFTDVGMFAGKQQAKEIISQPRLPLEERKTLSIEIFSWPTAGNIDLEECRRFCIQHVTNTGEILPFWEALFKNEIIRRSI